MMHQGRVDSPLRRKRLSRAMPPTLDEVAKWIRQYGHRCGPGHLSMVERGLKNPGPKLVALLAAYYNVSRPTMERLVDATLLPTARARGKRARRIARAG